MMEFVFRKRGNVIQFVAQHAEKPAPVCLTAVRPLY